MKHILTHMLLAAGLTGLTPALFAQSMSSSERLLCDSIPQTWSYTEGMAQTLPSYDSWWDTFNDPLLDSLINLAENKNFNLQAAIKRMEVAGKDINLAKSSYYPDINANAGWTRGQNAGAIVGKDMKSSTSSYFDIGLSASWEIDVFGRVAANIKVSQAGYNASKAEYDAMMVSLCSSLAKDYINLRTYQAQYKVAMAHLESQKKVEKITKARFEAGIGDMLEVTQAEIVVSSTMATIPGLETLISNTANSIAVLCGVFPEELAPRLLKPSPLPTLPPLPPTGVPADLLRRRPDILQAEAEVAQYAAQVGIAKKDFLPTLNINGEISTSSRNITGLFGSHSLGYSIEPTLSWTVFDGMARNYKVAEAKLQMQESIDSYNMTVMNAVSEVENSISQINSSLKKAQLEKETSELSEKSLQLSVDLYKRGLTAFSNVVDAQMNYLTYQNSQITSQADALTAMVSLYQALGGGF